MEYLLTTFIFITTAFVPKDLNNGGDTVNKVPPTPIVATSFSKESNLFA